MSQVPQVPASHSVPAGADEKSISRNLARRRIAIACGATAGVTFILAGLLAGSSVLPNVLDGQKDRDLRPVQISGRTTSGQSGGFGQGGSQGASGSAGSSNDHAELGRSSTLSEDEPGTPASEAEAPNLVLPGGINLNEVLDDTTDPLDDRLETAKNFVKDIIGQLPVEVPDLPVTVPTVPDLPVTIPTVPTVPELPVTVPPVTVPPTTLPAPITTVLDTLSPVTSPVTSLTNPVTSTVTVPSLP